MPPAASTRVARPRFWWRALALWLMIAAAEIVHGVLRTIFLVPWVGLHRSNQLGVLSGSLIIVLITRLTIRFLVGAETAVPARRLLAVGGFWLVLMLAFEWSAGHYVFGRTWDELAQDYRLAQGGLLPLGMLVLLFSPLIAARRWRLLDVIHGSGRIQ